MELRGGEEERRFLRLWDIYSALLTDNKKEISNLYFNCDLSLSEIAEEKGVSRQSVSDCINSCRKQIEEWEEKLHFSRQLDEISAWVKECSSRYPALKEELQRLQAILNTDFGKEKLLSE